MDAQTIVYMSQWSPLWLKQCLSNHYGGGLTEFNTAFGIVKYQEIVDAAWRGFDSPPSIQEQRAIYLRKFIDVL